MPQSIAWSEHKESYRLSNEFSIEKAEPRQFAVHLAIYDTDNVEMLLNWHDKLSFADPGTNGFWITKAGKRIGGVVLAPNSMHSFFVEPPFRDSYEVLKRLKSLLVNWSDRAKKIMLWGLPAYYEDFSRVGFWKHMTRRCMIRPTETFEQTLDPKYTVKKPQQDDEQMMAQLSCLARMNSLEAMYHKAVFNQSMTIEAEAMQYKSNLVEITADTLLEKASTCLYANNGELIAFCLITMNASFPCVADLVVHPAYQGQGLATYMLKEALGGLQSDYPLLRLFVTAGLNAEKLYYELGFQPGKAFTSFYLPEDNS